MNSPTNILISIKQLKNRMKNGKYQLQHMKKDFDGMHTKSNHNNNSQNNHQLQLHNNNSQEKQNIVHGQLNELRLTNDAQKCTKTKILALKKSHQKQIKQLYLKHQNEIAEMKQKFINEKEQLTNKFKSKIEEQANYILLLEEQLSPIQTQRQSNNDTKYIQIVNRLLEENSILIQQIQTLKMIIKQNNSIITSNSNENRSYLNHKLTVNKFSINFETNRSQIPNNNKFDNVEWINDLQNNQNIDSSNFQMQMNESQDFINDQQIKLRTIKNFVIDHSFNSRLL